MATPQQVFVMGKVRPASDLFGQLYWRCKALQNDYSAQNWAALFPNDATTLDDGSVSDGRPVLADADMVAFFAVISSYITYMEATGNANLKLVAKVGPNTEIR